MPALYPSLIVYFVRHGETDHNVQGIIQGQLDTELNAVGRLQAAVLADYLEQVPFTHAFTSDLKRAKETAEIILKHHPGVNLEPTPLLRERYLGTLEGYRVLPDVKRPRPVGAEEYPALSTRLLSWFDRVRLLAPSPTSFAPPKRLRRSSIPRFDWFKLPWHREREFHGKSQLSTDAGERYPTEPIVVLAVSHGASLGTLLSALMEERRFIPPEGFDSKRLHLQNTSVSKLCVWSNGEGVFESMGDMSHYVWWEKKTGRVEKGMKSRMRRNVDMVGEAAETQDPICK